MISSGFRNRTLGFAVAAVMITASSSLVAQGSAGQDDCLVTQAADQAIQRRIAMIDAAKVDPQEFFRGENSCISPQLLQSFDLSQFIPDLGGFLTGGIEGIVSNVLNQAKQQVCNVLNEQMGSLVGSLNGAGACFQSGLSADMASVLGGYSNIGLPSSSCGVGKFSVGGMGSGSANYGSVFGGYQPQPAAGRSNTQRTVQSVVAPAVVSPPPPGQTGGDSLVDSLSSIFSR